MGEKRVCFDFEIDFSNGGGIQGQGFRMDINGDDTADDVLSGHLIRDMRLLMVADVRILNKEIIAEPHKRSSPAAPSSAAKSSRPGVVDLSHAIEPGLAAWPDRPIPLIRERVSGTASPYDGDETAVCSGRIEIVAPTATSIDIPFHQAAGNNDLSEAHLERIANVPVVVLDVAGSHDRAIDWHHFVPIACRDRAVLVRTGWDQHWGSRAYVHDHPFLAERAAAYLRDQGALLVGIDSHSIDGAPGEICPARSILLAAGVPVIEHMANLAALPFEGAYLHAVPPRVRELGAVPVRVYAVLP